ncbi:MAG: hypothetical protein JWM57_390 [Phycisphaerales bacterium]|nr:hypothetical protein [Phycisphaerales bacterium]
MLQISLQVVTACAVLLSIGVAQAADTVQVRPPTSVPSAYTAAEWAVDVGRTYDNPYDPKQVAVDAVFIDAAGRKLVQPAFWRTAHANVPAGFCVRFAPDKFGRWTMHVDAHDDAGKRSSTEQSFDVAVSDRPGLLRVANNKRYFRFDNGRSYFPVGINLAWPPGDQRAEWYERTFATLAENGGNFARVWMAHTPVMIENGATGIGRYDDTNAEYFDRVLEAADRYGIRVMLCMVNHREFLVRDQWGDAGWPKSPYNAKNGGPATRPADFFSDPIARNAFKARLRYQVARYAALGGLGFWEFFNEQEFARTPVPTEWNAEMTAYLAALDPYHHLITTSAHVPPATYALPNMAITQAHLYGDGKTVDLVPAVTSTVLDHARFDKPHLIAEAGIDSNGPDTKYDPKGLGTAFHNEMWSAALAGSAGGAQYWWWDNYVEPKNLWREFRPLATFASEVDFASRDFRPVVVRGLHHANAVGRSDMVIPAAGGWGVTASREPVPVPPNGRPAKSLPSYFCGPTHQEEYVPINLDIDLPADSRLTLHAGQVSDYALLRVLVDGKPVGEMLFSATPGTPGTGPAKWEPEARGYRGPVTEPQSLANPIPVGKHRLTIDALAGDWVTLTGISLADAIDNRYANLDAIALQDAATKETLAWIYDPRSNWKNDLEEQSPSVQGDVTFDVPNVTDGSWNAIWYDTRKGGVVKTDHVTAGMGKLTLSVPAFTRDIALRLTEVK